MLRPELRAFYADDVRAIRERYGDYLLVNTNFNHVNAFFPAQNLFKPPTHPDEAPQFGKAGVGMTRAFAEALRDQKQAVFTAFQALIPELARAFPQLSIIVRPHPTEGQDVYRRLAAGSPRIHVTNEGNVVPWLQGASALVHNGCTTGVEAFVMRTPAFSFRPAVSEAIDGTFYVLSHGLSHQCFSVPELIGSIRQVLDGTLGAAGGEARAVLVNRHLTGQDGALACERMMDVVQALTETQPVLPSPALPERLFGIVMSRGRFLIKRLKAHFPGTHAPPEFHRHRYPGITLPELRRRIRRFQEILGDESSISAEAITPQIFSIRPGGGNGR
jgi:hypothetical protein